MSRLGKTTLIALSISLLLSVAFLVFALASGTLIPHQDPTPEQAAYERFQSQTFGIPLFIGWGISGLATLILGLAWVAGWVLRSIKTFWAGRVENASLAENRSVGPIHHVSSRSRNHL